MSQKFIQNVEVCDSVNLLSDEKCPTWNPNQNGTFYSHNETVQCRTSLFKNLLHYSIDLGNYYSELLKVVPYFEQNNTV